MIYVNFTINLGILFYSFLVISWLVLPIAWEWGKFYSKNNRKEKTYWQIISVLVVLPSLLVLTGISHSLLLINKVSLVIEKLVRLALNRLMMPK